METVAAAAASTIPRDILIFKQKHAAWLACREVGGQPFPKGTLRMMMSERDPRSGVNWMVTVGQEERRSPNLFAFPMDTVILTPVLVWDVLYGSGMENFDCTVSRDTAESEQRTPE